VIDTGELVLKQLAEQATPHKQKLIDALNGLRQSMAGV
jgi:hypothetical protein